MNKKAPVVLIIMDGVGNAPAGEYNAVSVANTPVLSGLTRDYPSTEIHASGGYVGLPDGQMGNSEVGHLNLGAGRIVKQDLVALSEAIEDGSFERNAVFAEAVKKIKNSGGRAHLMGLCSPGGVHSSLDHLYALVELLCGQGLEVFLHALTDGRDTPPSSARGYMADIERRLEGKARVAAIVGRFYSMDRDNRWERVETGYRAHVMGEGTVHLSADEGIAAAYEAGETDEFITPRIITDNDGTPIGKIEDGDGVFFFNFRSDRSREMTLALTDDSFEGFARPRVPKLASYVCMTEYQADFGLPVAFPPTSKDRILAEVLSGAGKTQFHCAETEKYAHVTFFFNGGREKMFPGEERCLVPSPQEVATYDLKPEMSAALVAARTVEAIESGAYDFVLVNFANGDMVGHTGVMSAAVKAVETVDAMLGKLTTTILSLGGCAIVTADHGNSEKMLEIETGEPHTAHTTNLVPCILVSDGHKTAELREGGALRDVAPTVLQLLGLEVPGEMSGRSLIE